MRRRRFLYAVVAGSGFAAGCIGDSPGQNQPSSTNTEQAPANTPTTTTTETTTTATTEQQTATTAATTTTETTTTATPTTNESTPTTTTTRTEPAVTPTKIPETTADAETSKPTLSSSVDVTPYRTLSERGQQLFERLLEQDAISVPSPDIPSQLLQTEYIRYRGSEYGLTQTQTDTIAEYSISPSTVDEGSIEDRSNVVAFDQLPSEAQAIFETALDEGGYTTRDGLPNQLTNYRYVKYQGEYYDLLVAVGDISVWRFSVSKVEGTTVGKTTQAG